MKPIWGWPSGWLGILEFVPPKVSGSILGSDTEFSKKKSMNFFKFSYFSYDTLKKKKKKIHLVWSSGIGLDLGVCSYSRYHIRFSLVSIWMS